MRLFLTLLLANATFTCVAQCPKAGIYKNEKEKKLKLLKNALASISHSQTSASLPLKNLIPSKKRIDKDLYLNGAFVTTEGYLISFEEEGPESCNCNKANKSKKNGDVPNFQK
jgi:hypothetical protein